jgi:hypothetical protein
MKPLRAIIPVLVAASLLAVLDVTRGAAEVPEHERVLVTDPALLESMGFPPTARNVYVWTQANTPESIEPQARGLDIPRYFGPSSSGFSPVFARAFQGRASTFAYSSADAGDDIFNTNPATENFADAQFDTIPDGASLEFFRVWFWDTNASQNITFFLFESCLPLFEAGAPTFTQLAILTSSGSAGNGSLTFGLAATATTQTCNYWARARFGNNPLVGPGDSTLRLYKARVQWARQVSPAPAVATFQDVPTTHPFFRWVEALASSGITVGCSVSPPLYCVNNPITRGEMAVFLARALGLDFGF